ncbi:MAG: ParB N-terminal domain-containing protein [Deltaproteobacteria bacterium]|nr:ParB N-terminal domain-containing protein [Deltaproteobacteria bacterium]
MALFQIHLLPIDRIAPSTYNPRLADEERLNLVALSLRKLGFLLPIYATPDGEIISGHQRYLVATRMGATRMPVVWTKPMDLPARKTLNILFNRGTNDMDSGTLALELKRNLLALDVERLAKGLPDIDPASDDFFPCVRCQMRPIAPYLDANRGRWLQYATNAARLLHRHKVLMPIVVTSDGKVLNGLGRLQNLAERKATEVPIVEVRDEQGPFVTAMLNMLSMDFDIHNRYSDMLRYHSFRRSRQYRSWLGSGYTFVVHPGKAAKSFDIGRASHRAKWVQEHGTSIVDFGAGHLTEANLLRAAGIDCAPFEPYRLTRNEIDKDKSLATIREFLATVASGKSFTSVFVCSVFNSVPFAADRQKIARICHALCHRYTRVYCSTLSDLCDRWQHVSGERTKTHRCFERAQGFVLDYESRVVLAELNDKPKMQKYHAPEELADVWRPLFARVRAGYSVPNIVNAICAIPRPLDPAALREALWFEFDDLPYSDGTTMGLGREALAAFSQRLGVDLS